MQNTQLSRPDRVRRLTLSGMMVALATVISFVCGMIPVPPFNFPFGGGITIAGMLPVILVAYLYGTRWGLLTGFVYSLIQMLLGHKTIAAMFMPGDEQMVIWKALLVCLIDYVLAYTALGLGGLFDKRKMSPGKGLVLSCLVALGVRYLCHIVSGAIFYGAWAEWFFGDAIGQLAIAQNILKTFSGASLAIIYSIVYNGCYMIPEMIITPLVGLLVLRIPAIRKRIYS